MPKPILGAARDIILTLISFNEAEKLNNGPVIPFDNVMARTAAMIGVSERTIYRIKAEGKNLPPVELPFLQSASTSVNNQREESGSPVPPSKSSIGKQKKLRKIKDFDDIDVNVVREKVQEYCSNELLPTLKTLHSNLKRDINFKGSSFVLKKVLHDMGFDYKKNKWDGNEEIEQDVEPIPVLKKSNNTTLKALLADIQSPDLVATVNAESVSNEVASADQPADIDLAEASGIKLLQWPVNVKIELDYLKEKKT